MWVTIGAAPFNKRAEILSRPLALLLGISWINFSISLYETSVRLKILSVLESSWNSEAKKGPILEKCVFSTLLISLGSVYTLLSVSSLVTLVVLDPLPISLFIPFYWCIFKIPVVFFKKGVVVVRFSILNFIINLISSTSIRGPVEVSWELWVYFL